MCQTYRAHRTPRHQRGACGKGQHPARGVRQTPFQNQGPGGRPPAPARSAPGSDRHPRRPPRRPHPGSPPPFRPQQPPPQPSPGTGTVDGGARESRKPAGERPRRSPPQDPREALRPRPRAPGPVRAGRRLLSARGPPALRTSQGPAPTRLPPPRQAARVRGAGCETVVAPETPPLAFAGAGSRWSASPSCRSSSLGFPPLAVRAERQRGVPPPRAAAPNRAGAAKAAAPTARGEGVGKGAEGYGTNGLDAPSQAHRSSDPERGGAGRSPGLRGGATPALHRPPSGDHPPRPVHFWHRSVWGRPGPDLEECLANGDGKVELYGKVQGLETFHWGPGSIL
ncbi:basic salivary proline-rich protein 1-like [Balaenoptera ricei]|uniref:basic salivary proline-rich protein 1-like n=1 Tax=Balaenoptera ricei TaxID=2746895 RepID=UPI0028BDFF86|nr:basic salivary proline-rich protein 1-like [Balaenoptera ricei]